MKKNFFLSVCTIIAIGCSSNETIIVSKLPKGLNFQKKAEKYNAFDGSYSLTYSILNDTDSSYQYGTITALAYIDGKIDETITGGISRSEYLKKGDKGEGELSGLFPNKRPDSVVLKLE